MTNIEVAKDILELTDASPPKDGETNNEFKLRLVEAVDELSDKEFEKLSDPAQDWIDAAITAIQDSDSNDIEEINFPPFPEESRKQREDDVEVVDSPDSGKRVRKQRKPVMSRKAKHGPQWDMKAIIFQNPDITWPALKNKTEELGHEDVSKSYCQILLANCRQDLKILSMLEMLKE